MIRRAIEKVGFGGAFLGLVAAVYMGLAILDYDRFGNALSASGRLAGQIFPILLLVFGLMFFANRFVEGNRIAHFLGRGSGFRGWMVAIGAGILSSGPIYMWYPLLSDLKGKGMEDALIAAFLYNRAVKIPLLPMMVYYFGWSFALVLSIYMVLFSVVNGILVQRVARTGGQG